MPENELVSILKKQKKDFEIFLDFFKDDPETKNIVEKLEEKLPKSFNDSNNNKTFSILFKELLSMQIKFGNYFYFHIFETEHDLIIGETPTISENFTPYEKISKEREVEHIRRNVFQWLPVAYNKVAFMYIANGNIVAQKDRKLRKQDVDILNYCQAVKNPYFYSRIPKIEIPELPSDFDWIKHFNYIFGYKHFLFPPK